MALWLEDYIDNTKGRQVEKIFVIISICLLMNTINILIVLGLSAMIGMSTGFFISTNDFNRLLKLVIYEQHICTGSTTLDAVINTKIIYIKDKDIKIRCQFVWEELDINEFDLSILIGNLLDKAIEACEK